MESHPVVPAKGRPGLPEKPVQVMMEVPTRNGLPLPNDCYPNGFRPTD